MKNCIIDTINKDITHLQSFEFERISYRLLLQTVEKPNLKTKTLKSKEKTQAFKPIIISSSGYDPKTSFVQFYPLPLSVFNFEFVIVFLEKVSLIRIFPYFNIQVDLQIHTSIFAFDVASLN